MRELDTMILIETDKNFDEYIKSLSKHARKDWVYVKKHNSDLLYECIPYERELVQRYMYLWEMQLIRGERKKWAFGIGVLDELNERGELLVFRARKGEETIAVHFVQIRSGFIECHPPMYDKKDSKRYLAKFMWFNLIRYAMENNLPPLDLGGGTPSWRETIKRRDEFPNGRYKWIFIPRVVKENPASQPDYVINGDFNYKWLETNG